MIPCILLQNPPLAYEMFKDAKALFHRILNPELLSVIDCFFLFCISVWILYFLIYFIVALYLFCKKMDEDSGQRRNIWGKRRNVWW